MKIILLQSVRGLGDPGQVVNVKSGYARNYLIPNDGNQFLFKGIKINTVEVDYAGNIWIGSDDGIFVFDNTKNKFVFQFNLSNSPILSDTIKNINRLLVIAIFFLIWNFEMTQENPTRP